MLIDIYGLLAVPVNGLWGGYWYFLSATTGVSKCQVVYLLPHGMNQSQRGYCRVRVVRLACAVNVTFRSTQGGRT